MVKRAALIYTSLDVIASAPVPRKREPSAVDIWLANRAANLTPSAPYRIIHDAARAQTCAPASRADARPKQLQMPIEYQGPPDPPGKRIAHVWTDGACGPTNPGFMGIGVYVEIDGLKETHSESLGFGTNNIAEIAAVKRGIAMAANRGLDGIVVHTDSQYAIGVIAKRWKAKKNVDLIADTKRTVAACGTHVEFRWVRGHCGVEGNEIADELADAAAVPIAYPQMP
jgi:ribonuclease HI